MKIVKGGSRTPPNADGPYSKAQMQRDMARQAALERSLAKYIRISCGHSSDLETQQVYGFARPKRGMVYCETCAKWLKVERVKPPPPPPMEPMFLWLHRSNVPVGGRKGPIRNAYRQLGMASISLYCRVPCAPLRVPLGSSTRVM